MGESESNPGGRSCVGVENQEITQVTIPVQSWENQKVTQVAVPKCVGAENQLAIPVSGA